MLFSWFLVFQALMSPLYNIDPLSLIHEESLQVIDRKPESLCLSPSFSLSIRGIVILDTDQTVFYGFLLIEPLIVLRVFMPL